MQSYFAFYYFFAKDHFGHSRDFCRYKRSRTDPLMLLEILFKVMRLTHYIFHLSPVFLLRLQWQSATSAKTKTTHETRSMPCNDLSARHSDRQARVAPCTRKQQFIHPAPARGPGRFCPHRKGRRPRKNEVDARRCASQNAPPMTGRRRRS